MHRPLSAKTTHQPHAVVFRYHPRNRYSFLALLASLEARQSGHNIQVLWLDTRTKAETSATLRKWLETYPRLLIAYSCMTSQWSETAREVRELKHFAERHRLLLAAGGPHPSASPRSVLQAGFDVVCSGDGEPVFPELVRRWAEEAPLDSLPGLYLRTPAGPVFTGRPVRISLDDFPALPLGHGKYGPIEITRGCTYNCRYCQTPRLKGRRLRHRSPASIFQTVEAMIRAGRTDVRFISPNAFAYGSVDGRLPNLRALRELLSGLRQRLFQAGRLFFGTFPSEVRPDWVHPEILELVVRYADNRQMVMGAQSGDPEMLHRMDRGHTVDDVRRASTLMKQFGIRPIVDFILGLPGETRQQMIRTVDFMEELAEEGARIHAHTFMPLPGSPWGVRKAETLPEEIRARLDRLISQGKLFGQWKAQAQWAQNWDQ